MNKYRAVQVKDDGITFASKMEHKRYCELKLLQKSGQIDSLEVHPVYPAVINDTKICNIILDFRYFDRIRRSVIVEDTKGFWNPLSRLKFKMLKALYPDLDVRLLTAK